MKYLSHISEDKRSEQTILEHLEETAQISKQFADAFGYGDWGYCCGKLHDVGKYSDKFQRRIQGSEERVDHATAGAQVCREKGGIYRLLAYCIAGHHGGLPDTGGSTDTADRSTFEGRMKKKVEDYQAYQKEIEIPNLHTAFVRNGCTGDPSFGVGFLIRMLYSCLVDADFLDTEKFMNGNCIRRQPGEDMKTLWARLQSHVSKWLECEHTETVNGRRTEILRHCMEMGEEEKGLFRLTVPTGGGKTVASLAFALCHAVEHQLSHIIYVIPYTSIIEQNAKVFSEILGPDNVLEDHCNVDYESSEELKPMQWAAENWDKPVIVTTNVQFFESLYSNKSAKCRKLHNIANSVIIFDEAQMLPNDYLKPCVTAMEEFSRYYRSSIILCTATQPALQHLFSEELSWRELCPRVEEQFQFFKRTAILNLGKIEEEELICRIQKGTQVLCICNTKRKVMEIYKKVAKEGVYHLSTGMYPVHRKRILEGIRKDLKNGETCIVIATSLVEAGVDLDFQAVYREMAGIDSMIQAAGRCNREGKRTKEESHTYIFQLEERGKIPGQEQQIDTGKQILRKYEDISELDAIREYFERLYNFRGEGLDKKNILGRFRKGIFPFAEVGREFRLIEQKTKTILIPSEDRAKEIVGELRLKGATKHLMREAGQFCVNVYENIFEKMNGAGMLLPVSEDLREELFVLRNKEDYAEETGLKMDIDTGIGVWY